MSTEDTEGADLGLAWSCTPETVRFKKSEKPKPYDSKGAELKKEISTRSFRSKLKSSKR